MRQRTANLLILLSILGPCSTLNALGQARLCIAHGAWYDDDTVIADAQAKIVQRGHFTGDLAAYARENPDCCRLTVTKHPLQLGLYQYEYKILVPIEEPGAAGGGWSRDRYISEGIAAYGAIHLADRCLRSDTFGQPMTESEMDLFWEYY